jgi:hypothetical protein
MIRRIKLESYYESVRLAVANEQDITSDRLYSAHNASPQPTTHLPGQQAAKR